MVTTATTAVPLVSEETFDKESIPLTASSSLTLRTTSDDEMTTFDQPLMPSEPYQKVSSSSFPFVNLSSFFFLAESRPISRLALVNSANDADVAANSAGHSVVTSENQLEPRRSNSSNRQNFHTSNGGHSNSIAIEIFVHGIVDEHRSSPNRNQFAQSEQSGRCSNGDAQIEKFATRAVRSAATAFRLRQLRQQAAAAATSTTRRNDAEHQISEFTTEAGQSSDDDFACQTA